MASWCESSQANERSQTVWSWSARIYLARHGRKHSDHRYTRTTHYAPSRSFILLLQSTLGLRPSTQEGPELPHRIRCGASAGWREVDLRHAEITRFGGQDCRWRISNGNSQIAPGPSWPPPAPANGDYWEVSSR